jgi:hypothetical protein
MKGGFIMIQSFTNWRQLLKAGGVLCALLILCNFNFPLAYSADKFPTKPFSIVSESAPGGSFDRAVRVLEPGWEKRTGQPVKFVIAQGAGGQIAATKIIRSPADGHTLGINAITNLQVMINFNKPKEFGPESFVYLGTINVESLAIIVRKDAKWQNFDELYKEAQDRIVNVGVGQPNTYYHLAGLILNDAIGTKFNYIHYGGGGASRRALIAGEVPVVLTGLFSAANIYNQTRGLLVFAGTNPIPDIWKMASSSDVMPGRTFPEFHHPTTFYLPEEVRKRYPDRFNYLVKIFRETHQAPDTKERAIKAGFPGVAWKYWTPDECKAYEKEFVTKLQALKR